jgi:trigger factor
MKVSIEEISPTKKKLQIEIPPPHVQEVIESLYQDLQKSIKLKGFRPGKIPRNILRQYYGDYVLEKAASRLIGETYPQVLTKEAIDPVAPPVIDPGNLEPERAFNYSAVVEILPSIELRDYKKFKLTGHKDKVTEDDVTTELERLRQMHAQLRPIEDRDAIQDGDILLIDFQSFLGNKPVREGKVDNYTLEVGSGAMVPGFEQALIGKARGEEHEITVTMPDEHSRKDLAGKAVRFLVTVKEIREKILPELDDEFAKDVGDYEDLKALREGIRKDIEVAKERIGRESLQQQVLDKLIEANPIEVPSYLVDRRTQEIIEDFKRQIQAGSKELDADEERGLREQYSSVAERDVKASLLVEQLAEQEQIEPTQDELTERIEKLATLYNRPAEELKGDSGFTGALRRSIRREQVMHFLIDQADIEWSEDGNKESNKK